MAELRLLGDLCSQGFDHGQVRWVRPVALGRGLAGGQPVIEPHHDGLGVARVPDFGRGPPVGPLVGSGVETVEPVGRGAVRALRLRSIGPLCSVSRFRSSTSPYDLAATRGRVVAHFDVPRSPGNFAFADGGKTMIVGQIGVEDVQTPPNYVVPSTRSPGGSASRSRSGCPAARRPGGRSGHTRRGGVRRYLGPHGSGWSGDDGDQSPRPRIRPARLSSPGSVVPNRARRGRGPLAGGRCSVPHLP